MFFQTLGRVREMAGDLLRTLCVLSTFLSYSPDNRHGHIVIQVSTRAE